MMIAHDEFIAGERIERVLEFGCLRDCKIARVHHSIELTLQQPLTGRFGQERKGLRRDECKGHRQQPVVHTDRAWRWILLDTKHPCHAGAAGWTVFDSLRSE